MALKISVPSNLNLEEGYDFSNLPTKQHSAGYLYYICSCVGESRLNFCKDVEEDDGFAYLCSMWLRMVHADYVLYLNFLQDHGILECDNGYEIGVKCKGYRFTERYRGVPFKEVELDYYKLTRNIRAQTEAINIYNSKLLSKHMYLIKWYFDGKIGIDAEQAKAWVDNHYYIEKLKIEQDIYVGRDEALQKMKYLDETCNRYRYLIEKIHTKSYDYRDFTLSDYGRLYGILAYLKKEVRNFITYNGQELISVDISNTQPYLSQYLFTPSFWKSRALGYKGLQLSKIDAELYKQARKNSYLYDCIKWLETSESQPQLGSSIALYKQLVNSGQFYNFMLEALQENLSEEFKERYEDRIKDISSVKKETLRIMNCSNSSLGRFFYAPCEVFEEEFPEVMKLFKAIKHNEYELLARILQRLESYFVLKLICGRITRERPGLPIFTIHDCVVTTRGNEEYVQSVIREEFLQITGIAPHIKLEHWCPNNLRVGITF